MYDQAQGLRDLLMKEHSNDAVRSTKVITVTSGKGGVGKSNFSLNFALALQARGFKVLIFDADIGMANIDVLMGISPPYNLYHLLKKQKTIWEIIQNTQYGIDFIAGGSGFNDLISLSGEELDYFYEQVEQLNGHVDFIIFDTGAGLSKETLKFIISAHETIIVTTPEPTAITDAYALIKMVHHMGHSVSFQLVVNQAMDAKEGRQTADKIRLVAQKFLQMDIPMLGLVGEDAHVSKAVRRQVPFTIAYPSCSAAKGIQLLADNYIAKVRNTRITDHQKSGIKGFLGKMLRFMQ